MNRLAAIAIVILVALVYRHPSLLLSHAALTGAFWLVLGITAYRAYLRTLYRVHKFAGQRIGR